jgi:hypothetical protein
VVGHIPPGGARRVLAGPAGRPDAPLRWGVFDDLLLVGSILAYAAAITSLGLALATWVSRLGRAVALCVTVYVAFSIGWTLVIVMLFSPEPLGRSLVIGSPAIGAFAGTAMIWPDSLPPWRTEGRVAAVLWITAYLVTASRLFAAAVSSFDRCLGRMPEDGGPPRARISAETRDPL